MNISFWSWSVINVRAAIKHILHLCKQEVRLIDNYEEYNTMGLLGFTVAERERERSFYSCATHHNYPKIVPRGRALNYSCIRLTKLLSACDLASCRLFNWVMNIKSLRVYTHPWSPNLISPHFPYVTISGKNLSKTNFKFSNKYFLLTKNKILELQMLNLLFTIFFLLIQSFNKFYMFYFNYSLFSQKE